MKYEVDCVFGGLRDDGSGDNPTHVDVMESIEAVYENTAHRGGRVVMSNTLWVGEPLQECLFLVSEIPEGPSVEAAGSV